jgi:hypothetical protein
MECVVSSELPEKIETINARIARLLANTRLALSGERVFSATEVRALSEPLAEMAPILERAVELRALHPEVAPQLDFYKAQLRELQTVLEQIRVMLLAQRAQMDGGRLQLAAVTHWAKALGRTL